MASVPISLPGLVDYIAAVVHFNLIPVRILQYFMVVDIDISPVPTACRSPSGVVAAVDADLRTVRVDEDVTLGAAPPKALGSKLPKDVAGGSTGESRKATKGRCRTYPAPTFSCLAIHLLFEHCLRFA